MCEEERRLGKETDREAELGDSDIERQREEEVDRDTRERQQISLNA